MTSPGYLRFPHIANDLVVFVAADDVWLAPLAGGRAWRFTADEAPAATPRLTPDGTHVAWVSPSGQRTTGSLHLAAGPPQ